MPPIEIIGAFAFGALATSMIYLAAHHHSATSASAAASELAAREADSSEIHLGALGISAFGLADFTLHLMVEKQMITPEERVRIIDEAITALSTNPLFVDAANNMRKLFGRPPFGSSATAIAPAGPEGTVNEPDAARESSPGLGG